MNRNSTNEPPKRIDPDILGRILAGGGSKEERDRVEEFLREHPELQALNAQAWRMDDAGVDARSVERGRELLARWLGMERRRLEFWGESAGDDAQIDPAVKEGISRVECTQLDGMR